MNAIIGVAVAVLLAPVGFGRDADFYRSAPIRRCGPIRLRLSLSAIDRRRRPAVDVALPDVGRDRDDVHRSRDPRGGPHRRTRGRAVVDRLLIAVAAFGFAPVVYELLLGQVTLLLAAALYPVARRRDSYRSGLFLGFVLAVAPKPMLLPVLAWMLVWRRRALGTAMATALAMTALGVALTGLDQYGQWLSVITGAGQASVGGSFALSLSGNYSLWPLDQLKVVVAVVIGAATLWVILQEPSRGFVAALLAGLLLAPYTGLYAISILLVAVKPALAFAPRATRLLALTANLALGLLFALVPWGVFGLAACLRARTGSTPALNTRSEHPLVGRREPR